MQILCLILLSTSGRSCQTHPISFPTRKIASIAEYAPILVSNRATLEPEYPSSKLITPPPLPTLGLFFLVFDPLQCTKLKGKMTNQRTGKVGRPRNNALHSQLPVQIWLSFCVSHVAGQWPSYAGHARSSTQHTERREPVTQHCTRLPLAASQGGT